MQERPDKYDALAIATLIAIALLALAQSWNRWLDPIIDTGRDLYIPERLAHGATLYRDVRYQYLPLAPYLLTAITSAIGHSLASYTAIGIAQVVACAALLFTIARRVANTAAGFAAAAMFLGANATAANTWGANWIFPYSYAATIGMLALLAMTGALWRYVSERRALAVAICAALVASWCKLEYTAAVVLIVVVTWLIYRLPWRAFAMFVVAGAASLVVAGLVFHATPWRENVFAASLTSGASAKHFYALVSGRADWALNLRDAMFGLLASIAVVLVLRMRSKMIAVALVAVIACWLGDHAFTRAFGLVQWLALAWAVARDRTSPLALFAITSIAATLRIPLNVSPAWYGFVLVVPVYLLIAYVVFAYLPSRGVYTHRMAHAWLLVVAVFVVRDVWKQHGVYAAKQFPIVTMRGTFYDLNPDRAAVLNDFFARRLPGSLAVIPEGITLNYLAAMPTTLTFHTFTPVETADAAIEQQIIGEMRAHAPERIAIVSRDVREFGYRGFGADYDLALAAWIRAHYRIEWMKRGPAFELIVFRRTAP